MLWIKLSRGTETSEENYSIRSDRCTAIAWNYFVINVRTSIRFFKALQVFMWFELSTNVKGSDVKRNVSVENNDDCNYRQKLTLLLGMKPHVALM